MGREQLGRATKQEATRKFEEPFRAKINHKELRVAKAKALAETLLKQWNIPRSITGMLRKKPRKLKRLRGRKSTKTKKIRLRQFADDNMEDIQNLMFAPHLNVNFSRSRFIKGHEDSPFVFLQRNLAYQVAFDQGLSLNEKATRYKENVHRVPQYESKTLWVHLSRFRIGKRKFFKYPFDINVEVYVVKPGNPGIEDETMGENGSKVNCRKIASFFLPFLDQSPCAKFSERRFYPKQFCEFPIEISANSLKPNSNLNSTLVMKMEAVPTNCGPNLRPNVPKGFAYIDIVKKGVLALPRKNAYELGLNFLDWSLRKISYPTVGFIGAINEAPNLGFTERCLSKRSVTRMGQFYFNLETSLDKKSKDVMDLSQLVAIEEENEDEDLESYIEDKLQKMSLEKEQVELNELSQKKTEHGSECGFEKYKKKSAGFFCQKKKKRGLAEIIPMLEKRALTNVSKKSSNFKKIQEVCVLDSVSRSAELSDELEGQTLSSECLYVEPRELNKFNFCPKLGKYVVFVGDNEDQKVDAKSSDDNTFTKDEMNESCGDTHIKEMNSKQSEEKNDDDGTEQSVNDEQRRCKTLNQSVVKLTGNFVYEESNVLPVEINLVLNNGSVVKRTLNCLQCVFCVRRFDSYEILLLHLSYSHIGYNVIHFPSNHGSMLEIRVNDESAPQSKRKPVVAQTMVEEPGQITKKSRGYNQRGKTPKNKENTETDTKSVESAPEVKNENDKESSGKNSQKTAANNDKKVQQGNTRTEIQYESSLNGFIFKAHKKVEIRVAGKGTINESTVLDDRKLIVELPQPSSGKVLSENQLELAKRNMIGFMALNQVGMFALRKSKKLFHKVCKTSLTPGGFYHSRAMTERTAVTQGYCSDNDEDVYSWYDESQQR